MAAYNRRQLKYFITTVECGSVAEASRKLYIAQPSISTAIKGLEDSFGVQLLIRHHAQGVSLTPSGATLLPQGPWNLLRMAKGVRTERPGRQRCSVRADRISAASKPSHRCTCCVIDQPGFRRCTRGGNAHPRRRAARTGAGPDLRRLLIWRSSMSTISTAPSQPNPLMPAQRPYALLPADHRFAQQAQVSLRDLCLEPMILLGRAARAGPISSACSKN